METQFRQGDFLFTLVEEIPEGAQPEKRDHGLVIIGYGEVTGHHHSFAEPTATIRTMVTDHPMGEMLRFIDAPEGVTVKHQEHRAITLPPGKYSITQQRQYNAGMVQRVVD